MRDLNITIVQTSQFWEDKELNLDHFSKILGQPKEPTDLILFPEMFHTAFSMNTSLAEGMDGKGINWLRKQAEKFNVHIGATLMIKEEARIFNRFVIVNQNGVIAQYDKVHLFSHAQENQHFSSGSSRVIVELYGWKILLQTCYDLRFPIFSRNSNNQDRYDCCIYLANWPEKRNYAWSNLLQARAIENQVYVVGVNRIGEDGNNINYIGQSTVYDPWGNELLKPHYKMQLIHVKLEQEILKNIREKFNTLKDII